MPCKLATGSASVKSRGHRAGQASHAWCRGSASSAAIRPPRSSLRKHARLARHQPVMQHHMVDSHCRFEPADTLTAACALLASSQLIPCYQSVCTDIVVATTCVQHHHSDVQEASCPSPDDTAEGTARSLVLLAESPSLITPRAPSPQPVLRTWPAGYSCMVRTSLAVRRASSHWSSSNVTAVSPP